MQEYYLNTVQQFNERFGAQTFHPQVSVVRMNSQHQVEATVYHYGVYALFLKENKSCKLSYGRTKYDFDEMSVTSFAPGQTVTIEPVEGTLFPKWTAIVFDPDFLARTALGRKMSRYEFFSYSSNEALHLSQGEIEIFRGVVELIDQEIHRAIDKHTRELIVSNIELLLNYCLRFYDRQFITREELNHSVVNKFDALLKDYIANDAEKEGLPTVAYFAEKCFLSKGYFGELVKVETGRNAKDIIADQILIKAKELLNDDMLTVARVSERLGFDYPQHFVRFFKSHTGKTPSQYRQIV